MIRCCLRGRGHVFAGQSRLLTVCALLLPPALPWLESSKRRRWQSVRTGIGRMMHHVQRSDGKMCQVHQRVSARRKNEATTYICRSSGSRMGRRRRSVPLSLFLLVPLEVVLYQHWAVGYDMRRDGIGCGVVKSLCYDTNAALILGQFMTALAFALAHERVRRSSYN